ncbi:MAG: GEVED domain-containing protein [Spirosomataceae bacterium]
MKHLLLPWLICFFTFNFAYSQHSKWCRTAEPTESQRLEMSRLVNSESFRNAKINTNKIINIAVKPHIVRKSDGSGGFDTSTLNAVFDTLNKQYIGAGIQFFISGNTPNYIDNDKYFIFDSDAHEGELTARYDVRNAINLYFVSEFADNIGGYAYFPSTDRNTNRIFVYYANISDMVKRVVPHEMGHYMGLWHTFQDAWDSRLAELVTRGEGANCSYAGDMICDTPADPYGRIIFIGGVDCGFNYDYVDANNEKFKPQTGNTMSYYRGCGNFLTAGQHRVASFGVLTRISPDRDSNKRYTITGQGEQSITVTTAAPTKNNSRFSAACLGETISVPFSTTGNVAAGTKYKVLLISERSDFAGEIGSGSTSPIECKIPNNAPYFFSYRLQVVSEDESIRGTLTAETFRVTHPAKVTISGNENIFEGEIGKIYLSHSGGSADIRITSSTGVNYNYRISDIYSPVTYSLNPSRTATYKISSITNICGEGTASGEATISVFARPQARKITVSNLPSSFCAKQELTLPIFADGILATNNTYKVNIIDGESGQAIEVKHTSIRNDAIRIVLPENLIVGKDYQIKVSSTSPSTEYLSPKIRLREPFLVSVSGSRNILRGQESTIEVTSNYTPFSFKLSDGKEISSSTSPYRLTIKPEQDTQYRISAANNAFCGANAEISGEATIKVQNPIKTGFITQRNICTGQKIKVGFEQDQIGISGQLVVQLGNSKNEYIDIPTTGSSSPLEVTIPQGTPTGDGYKLRVVSVSQKLIGSESNEFEIKSAPIVRISGYGYGNANFETAIPMEISGTLPINLTLSDGTSLQINALQQKLAFKPTKTDYYSIVSAKNECGEGNKDGRVWVEFKANASAYCSASARSNRGQYFTSRVRLFNERGTRIFSSFDFAVGQNGYTDQTNHTIYIQKQKQYYLTVAAYVDGDEAGGGGWNTPIRAWIDYNQDYQFTKDEMIITRGEFSVGTNLTIPQSAKDGFTRMRIRTFYDAANETNLDNPCGVSEDGETEDYVVYLTNDSNQLYEIVPSISNMNSSSLDLYGVCRGTNLSLFFSTKGFFSESNTFVAELVDITGTPVAELGRTKFNNLNVTIPDNITTNQSYAVRVRSLNPVITGQTNRFRVNDAPTATISGDATISKGQTANLVIRLTGGGMWNYQINNFHTSNSFSTNTNTRDQTSTFTVKTKPLESTTTFSLNYVRNSGCGNGNISGKATITVLPEDSNRPNLSFKESVFSTCKGYGFSINLNVVGKLNPENYYTAQLVDLNDQFVTHLGIAKNTPFTVTIPSQVNEGVYKIKIISSSPSVEVISNSFPIFGQGIAELSGDTEIIRGETATLKVTRKGFVFGSSFRLSDNTDYVNINAEEYYIKVKPLTTTTYRISGLRTGYCGNDIFMGSPTVKVVAPRANKMFIGNINDACVGSTLSVPISFDGSQATKNPILAQINDSKSNFSRVLNGSVENSNLLFTIPSDAPKNGDYKVKIISQSPYLTTESNSFSLKESVNATISGGNDDVYETEPIGMKVDFTGESPWNLQLSDGSRYNNIKTSPFLIDKKANVRNQTFTISTVTSNCGIGSNTGRATFNILPLPIIKTGLTSETSVCQGKSFSVGFNVQQSKFRANNQFKVTLYSDTTSSAKAYELFVTNGNSPVTAQIPKSVPARDKYYVKVSGINPQVEGSFSPVSIKVRPLPTATIQGEKSIIEGDESEIKVSFTGESPWTFKVSDGQQLSTTNNPVSIKVKPQSTSNFVLETVSNVCGEGDVSGNAIIKVYPESAIEDLVNVYPIPSNSNITVAIDEALSKYPVTLTLFDTGGKVIRSAIVDLNTPLNRNFFDVSYGMYILKIQTYKKTFSRKVVKY